MKIELRNLVIAAAGGSFKAGILNMHKTGLQQSVDITDQVAEIAVYYIQHNPLILNDGESYYQLRCDKLTAEEVANLMATGVTNPAPPKLDIPERKIILP